MTHKTQTFPLTVTVKISVRRDSISDQWYWHLGLVRPRNLPVLYLGAGYAYPSEQDAWDAARAAADELEDACLTTQ